MCAAPSVVSTAGCGTGSLTVLCDEAQAARFTLSQKPAGTDRPPGVSLREMAGRSPRGQ